MRGKGRTAALALLAALYPLLRRPILTWGATREEASSRTVVALGIFSLLPDH